MGFLWFYYGFPMVLLEMLRKTFGFFGFWHEVLTMAAFKEQRWVTVHTWKRRNRVWWGNSEIISWGWWNILSYRSMCHLKIFHDISPSKMIKMIKGYQNDGSSNHLIISMGNLKFGCNIIKNEGFSDEIDGSSALLCTWKIHRITKICSEADEIQGFAAWNDPLIFSPRCCWWDSELWEAFPAGTKLQPCSYCIVWRGFTWFTMK